MPHGIAQSFPDRGHCQNWTADTPSTKPESCCTRCHFSRVVRTLHFHLVNRVVSDIFELVREVTCLESYQVRARYGT